MTSEEFIKTAVQSGYARRDIAELFVENAGKSEFSSDDFVRLYRLMDSVCEEESRIHLGEYGLQGLRSGTRVLNICGEECYL